ncbi:MAG: hypothetical protein IPP48_00725 [Chitinophagaceae bacterium]|nr:hypothetical protein [Chitinophagaceae bacterium]
MLKKLSLLLFICVLLLNIVKAQAPGGISTGLSLWLKANTTLPANITYNTTNNVSNWKSDIGTYQVSQATAAKRPVFFNNTGGTGIFNYNPMFNLIELQLLI